MARPAAWLLPLLLLLLLPLLAPTSASFTPEEEVAPTKSQAQSGSGALDGEDSDDEEGEEEQASGMYMGHLNPDELGLRRLGAMEPHDCCYRCDFDDEHERDIYRFVKFLNMCFARCESPTLTQGVIAAVQRSDTEKVPKCIGIQCPADRTNQELMLADDDDAEDWTVRVANRKYFKFYNTNSKKACCYTCDGGSRLALDIPQAADCTDYAPLVVPKEYTGCVDDSCPRKRFAPVNTQAWVASHPPLYTGTTNEEEVVTYPRVEEAVIDPGADFSLFWRLVARNFPEASEF
eukprot:gnl/Hemi2/17880_TR5899_c0_g1_i1.p1 gnl/Hemi2/17880_TR5899_c0_g1~~gnl/Hemi2/17880_TR5899_c0_g1_i1.p1  ORF type:complete len:291 (-),score=91.33 gnl/Hemi2/17880_TR5899_c0_g1_i1:99-971(-)